MCIFENLHNFLNNFSFSQTWKGLKAKARKAHAEAVISRRESGNDVTTRLLLEHENERILNIIGDTHGNGLDIIPESGTSK